MEHVPRGFLRWTLIVALVIWVAFVLSIGWGVGRNYAEGEHRLIKLFLEGKK